MRRLFFLKRPYMRSFRRIPEVLASGGRESADQKNRQKR
jgi:hypothetical protein